MSQEVDQSLILADVKTVDQSSSYEPDKSNPIYQSNGWIFLLIVLLIVFAIVSFLNYGGDIGDKEVESLSIRRRKKLAKNPNTSEEVLQQLAQDENQDVRWEVAKNPNTSEEVLQQLARDEIVQVRAGVGFNSNTPVALLQQLASEESFHTRLTVANNPNTPEAILQQLAQDKEPMVKDAALLGLRGLGPRRE